jgi:glucose/mannose-6-phosphate isomerase
MLNLDDTTIYEQLDPAGMRERIAELPRQCADAWAMTRLLTLPDSYRQTRRVAILGMGGSAIGGALLAGLVADECTVPIHSVSGYDLPAYVGPESLAVGSSYSGDTEEALSAFTQAVERGCQTVAVTTGGQLATMADEKGVPLIRFDYRSCPRAALGYSFTLLLGLLCRLGFLRDYSSDLDEAVAVMEAWQRELAPGVPTDRNPAKQLAARLLDRLPVVYGSGFLAAVARRWKGQFNENGKNWAFWEELPELNHNAVVGYGLPEGVRERALVTMLRSPLDHTRVQVRWNETGDLLLEKNVAMETLWGRGENRLAQMLSLIHFGDHVSLYLAMLNGADPSTMVAIDELKRRLAEV